MCHQKLNVQQFFTAKGVLVIGLDTVASEVAKCIVKNLTKTDS